MTKTKSIYLCGPINGTDYDTCAQGWRKDVHDALPEFHVYSPMRQKGFLRDIVKGEKFTGDPHDMSPVSTTQGILGRDHHDVITCDLLFANFIGSPKGVVSIGSMFEIAWAWDRHKPIILCMEKEGNVHQHLFVKGTCTYWVHSVQDGIYLAKSVLTPGL